MKVPSRRSNPAASTQTLPESPPQADGLARRQVLGGLLGAGVGGAVGLPAWAAKGDKADKPVEPAPVWKPDHTVIVVLENLSAYDAAAGQRKERKAPVYDAASDWRFLNELADKGARFSNSNFGRTPYNSPLPTRSGCPG